MMWIVSQSSAPAEGCDLYGDLYGDLYSDLYGDLEFPVISRVL